MNFTSFEFYLFLPLVFALYWLMKGRTRPQNVLLLLASYLFYGWWDWRFLILIMVSSVTDYVLGLAIENQEDHKKKKWLLYLSVGVNLGILGFFKYFNFFISSFIAAFELMGIHLSIHTLNIVLPVGISFYTFQTLSYTIDIYRGRIKATRDWVSFFTFVAFFPQLVAGPIERAAKMIPQFQQQRQFEYKDIVEGFRFILYGMFKKIVIADYCGAQANEIFDNYQAYGGSDLFLGIYIFFIAQLYCDFSAYSEIAIGIARLFGFRLSRNFAYPLYPRSVEDFWQRWHITLNKWFRDYMYMSMARSYWAKLGKPALIVIMFTAIGLWHGAKWTFTFWGFANGLLFVFYIRYQKPKQKRKFVGEPQLKDMFNIVRLTLVLGFLLIFFRAPDIASAFGYMRNMLSPSLFSVPTKWPFIFWTAFMYIWEWQFRRDWHGLAVGHLPGWQRWSIYIVMIFITMHHFGQEKEFIYFQF